MKIKLVGIGGAGRNIVNTIIDAGIDSSLTVYMDTDINALPISKSAVFVQLGKSVFNGYGTGREPQGGLAAAQSSEREIVEVIKDCDRIILIAGLGGGVGSGATPYIVSLAKRDTKAEVIAVVTLPTTFEGKRSNNQAAEAYKSLRELLGKNLHAINIPINIPHIGIANMFDAADRLVLERIVAELQEWEN